MLTPRKLIAFLTLVLAFFSTLVWADCSSLGSGWVQGTSSGGVTVCVPTGDNPNGAISSGEPVLTQNGKDYYAPPSSMADKLQVDSTGRIARTLDEVTRITRADGSTYVYTTSATFYTEAGTASSAVWDKVKANPTSFPNLFAAVSALPVVLPTTVGTVFSYGSSNYLVTSISSILDHPAYGFSPNTQQNNVFAWANDFNHFYLTVDAVYPGFSGYSCTVSATNAPVTPPSTKYSDLSPAISALGSVAEAEFDSLIAQHPELFKKSYTPSANEGLTAPPIPTALTPERIAEIYAGNGAPSGAGSPTVDPVTGTPTLGDPVEVPQPSDSGSGGDPTSDVYGPGYTPGFNNSPYGSDGPGGAEFGNRLSQFMSDLRGSSLFSLPTSILGNIPSSGTSAISFDGGQFGQQSFDFSVFSNQLMIIRSVLLLCFSLLSIRIVTLKR